MRPLPGRLREGGGVLEDAAAGKGREGTALLPELADAMAMTSICGLGQAALNPILSAMRHFPGETA